MLHVLTCLSGSVPVCLCPEVSPGGAFTATEDMLPLLLMGNEPSCCVGSRGLLGAFHILVDDIQHQCAMQVTDEMLLAAAVALADYVSEERLEAGNIYPELADLREISPVVSSLFSPRPG